MCRMLDATARGELEVAPRFFYALNGLSSLTTVRRACVGLP